MAREGKGNPLWYSCLENPMDRWAWWAAVHGVANSQWLGRTVRTLLKVRREAKCPLLVGINYIVIPINFHEESGTVTFWSNELSAPLDVSKVCEALCPEEVEDYGFL